MTSNQSLVDVPAEYFEERYTDAFADVNGLRLHYTDWNPTADRTVVLVHGLDVQGHTWDPLADQLANDYRVIVPDSRGHGDSSWGPDYWLRSFVSDLGGIADHVGLDEFALIGHSLGAKIVLAYAGEAGDRVTHVALSDTGPEMPASAAKYVQTVVAGAADKKAFRDLDEAEAHYRAINPEWREVFFHLHAKHQLKPNWVGKLVPKADPELFWLTGSAGRKEIPYVWDMTAKIQAPTLVLWGERSNFFDRETADTLLAALPNGELSIVPDCSHYIPREQPESFLERVHAFLK